MRLRTRVTLVAVAGFIAIAIVTVAVGVRFIEARAAADEVVEELQPAADAVDDLVVAIANMGSGVKGYVITSKSVSLETYVEGYNSSQRNLAVLRQKLPESEPQLVALLDKTQASRDRWVNTYAQPTIDLVRAGNASGAGKFISSDPSSQAYDVMAASANQLQDAIDDRRTAEFAQLEHFTELLAVELSISLLLLLAGLSAAIWATGRWILRPLAQLGAQLRTVARGGNREMPVEPSGPPELRETGEDAEHMRRQLVFEIDEARMAREGLAQDAPVVAGIRAELTRPPSAETPEILIYGELQPAEGVLAGDWWDSYPMPDGRTVIVVTDISGHGPEAGLAGLRLKTSIRSNLTAGISIVDALRVGTDLFAETPSRFATCVAVAIDPATQSVEWCNAGHLAPLVITRSGAEVSLEPTGPILSALGGEWHSDRASFGINDTMLIWTDGISESHDESGEQLEEEGLRKLIHQEGQAVSEPPAETVPRVLAAARNRATDWRRDDVTLIAAQLRR